MYLSQNTCASDCFQLFQAIQAKTIAIPLFYNKFFFFCTEYNTAALAACNVFRITDKVLMATGALFRRHYYYALCLQI